MYRIPRTYFIFAFISSSLVSLKSSFKHGFQHASFLFHRLKIYKMEWVEENQQKSAYIQIKTGEVIHY